MIQHQALMSPISRGHGAPLGMWVLSRIFRSTWHCVFYSGFFENKCALGDQYDKTSPVKERAAVFVSEDLDCTLNPDRKNTIIYSKTIVQARRTPQEDLCYSGRRSDAALSLIPNVRFELL